MCLRRLALILVLSVLMGCNRADHQLASTAIESLKQVRAATEVGMTYEQYSTRVIDAKARVDAASDKLADDDLLKEELNATMNCYADGVSIWQMKLNGQKLYMNNSFVAKYPVESQYLYTDSTNLGNDRGHWANADAVLHSALASADFHLSKAIALLD